MMDRRRQLRLSQAQFKNKNSALGNGSAFDFVKKH
jgi:hypothetical protein